MSWSRLIDRVPAAVAVCALILLAGSAAAEDPSACGQFKWPLATEKTWFEAGNLKDLQSGASVGEAADGAFTITLKASAEVRFALPPEGKPKPDKPLGAIISFAKVATPGIYQVTLSDEAWIDIVQDGAFRPSLEFSGVHGCRRVIRKSGYRFSVRSRAKYKIPIMFITSGRDGLK